MSGSSYSAEDLAHHVTTSDLSVANTDKIMELATQYSSGTITYAEYLKELAKMKEQTTGMYESYINEAITNIESYANTNSSFDFTAVLKSLNHAASNPGDSLELTNFLTNLYEKSLNISDLNSLDVIEQTISSTNLIPDILTLTSTAAKVSQEELDSQKENTPNPKVVEELKNLKDYLLTNKIELLQEEIESLTR